MIALLILTTYFPRLEGGARPSPTLGPRVFQTTALSVLKVPNMREKMGRATRQRYMRGECPLTRPVLSCVLPSTCNAGYTNSARHVWRQAQHMLSTRTAFVVIGAHNPGLSTAIYSSQDSLLMRMRSTRD